jgi:5S rRNA maturation endonuclease (ribonuclease M5)
MIPNGYKRVTRQAPCPCCGKPDWCLVATDGTTAICPRTESAKRMGDAGYLHTIDPMKRDAIRRESRKTLRMVTDSTIDFAGLWRMWMQATLTARVADLADELGVSRESLSRVGCARAESFNAWAFPMRSPNNTIVGVRLRGAEGRKFAVRGSRSALFIPRDLAGVGPLVVCEGPTDCAAMLDLGFDAIGRPDCQSGRTAIADLMRRMHARDVVIFADADGPGLRGAEMLAADLWMPVRIVAPPRHKDIRDWKCAGATRAAVESIIRAAPYVARRRSA